MAENTGLGLGVYSSENLTLEYKTNVGDWTLIPGIQDVSVNGSTAPPRDIVMANNASMQKTGKARVGTVTCNAFYLPQSPAWGAMRDAQRDNSPLHFRIRWASFERFRSASGSNKGTTINTTTAAKGTIVRAKGTDSSAEAIPGIKGTPFAVGMMLYPGTWSGTTYSHPSTAKGYVITSISDDATPVITVVDSATLDTPADVLAATTYSLYDPAPLELVFSASVSQGSDMDMGAEGEMSTTLVLAPYVELPDPVVYLP